MKNIFLGITLVFCLALAPISLKAQEVTLPAPVQEESQPTLPIGTGDTNQPTTSSSTISEETQQTFINGVIAGALGGLVIGGIFAWFLKDKIIK